METVVIDANIGVALVCPLPYSRACRDRLEEWLRQGVNLVVPALWDYEIAAALRKQWAQNLLPERPHWRDWFASFACRSSGCPQPRNC